ncbi:hypothetical protein GN958_ATG08615 [Phytophthora infestans]|uniref:Uncharacterized protein n=1 Tax=Phytophthora infestans TaxID=4787 RepID=A0A8S9UNX4_PHYIN|nr:hypothetical protein GN958_ATG08615 [Phytophthora infestans]
MVAQYTQAKAEFRRKKAKQANQNAITDDAQDNDVIGVDRMETSKPIATGSTVVVQCPLADDVVEPPSKRQKVELEAVLERFLSEQKESQQEQREHERTRLKEQQDLQRQTVELQSAP